ncbi:MSMEG_0570 family nitrogen starvation response protein [Mesorhizobium sp. J428]|uniref:MSMEG_0570 family nitrogen starvation response protein n=1 Tax=Mesorhizobium sp. J428 TaxID=2898440 RepID=UPI002150D015|nr:MSMEG_0570 family nitrogen starvation response protein [Mesorhizobium sp. J428]MCR5858100.1 MSMEG_0570 family nitrogen starvation response protein [Mesorhizobium sp. J428]
MPEMRFVIVWPDDRREECYSPSLVIKDYFSEGQTYPLDEFLRRSRDALNIASERVRAKYGRPCTLALGQLQRIETTAARFHDDPRATVTCEVFILDNPGAAS